MRHLPDALRKHFDQQMFPVGQLDSTELFLLAARSCVGITEVGGDNCGPLVELFQSSVGQPVKQPWCLDFIQACIAYVEAVKNVSSRLTATEHVLTLWESSKAYSAAQPPQRGDLILWRFGETSKGHCGIITGMDSLRYQTIEGNTSDSNLIEREGDGVYLKNRAKGGSKTFVEIGFLRCFL